MLAALAPNKETYARLSLNIIFAWTNASSFPKGFFVSILHGPMFMQRVHMPATCSFQKGRDVSQV